MTVGTPRPRAHVHSNRGAGPIPESQDERPVRCPAAYGRVHAGSGRCGHWVVAGHDQDPGPGVRVGGHGLGGHELIRGQPPARREPSPGRIQAQDRRVAIERRSHGKVKAGMNVPNVPSNRRERNERPVARSWLPGINRHPGRIGQQRGQQARCLAKFRGQGGRRQVSRDHNVVRLQP